MDTTHSHIALIVTIRGYYDFKPFCVTGAKGYSMHCAILLSVIIKGYRTGSTIYLSMYEQMQIPNELVSSGCINKCDNAIIMYLLVHF